MINVLEKGHIGGLGGHIVQLLNLVNYMTLGPFLL